MQNDGVKLHRKDGSSPLSDPGGLRASSEPGPVELKEDIGRLDAPSEQVTTRAETLRRPIGSLATLQQQILWDEPVKEGHLDEAQKADAGLRLFWWNIESGNRSSKRPDRPLDRNLAALVESPLRPDVMALGDYKPGALSEETEQVLDAHYPERQFVPYNDESPDQGILILSTHPFSEAHTAPLDYAPIEATEEERAAYRAGWTEGNPDASHYPRTYRRVTLDHPVLSRPINLVPTHAVQTWNTTLNRGPKAVAAVLTGFDVVFNGSSPLVNQLRHLRATLSDDLGPDLDDAGAVVFGDFNMLRQFGVRTKAYSTATSGLIDLFLDAKDAASWPAASAPEFRSKTMNRKMQIDHAFASRDITREHAQVLPMAGSDHYPLYMVVR